MPGLKVSLVGIELLSVEARVVIDFCGNLSEVCRGDWPHSHGCCACMMIGRLWIRLVQGRPHLGSPAPRPSIRAVSNSEKLAGPLSRTIEVIA